MMFTDQVKFVHGNRAIRKWENWYVLEVSVVQSCENVADIYGCSVLQAALLCFTPALPH